MESSGTAPSTNRLAASSIWHCSRAAGEAKVRRRPAPKRTSPTAKCLEKCLELQGLLKCRGTTNAGKQLGWQLFGVFACVRKNSPRQYVVPRGAFFDYSDRRGSWRGVEADGDEV